MELEPTQQRDLYSSSAFAMWSHKFANDVICKYCLCNCSLQGIPLAANGAFAKPFKIFWTSLLCQWHARMGLLLNDRLSEGDCSSFLRLRGFSLRPLQHVLFILLERATNWINKQEAVLGRRLHFLHGSITFWLASWRGEMGFAL